MSRTARYSGIFDPSRISCQGTPPRPPGNPNAPFPSFRLAGITVNIAGIGAIGRQFATKLAQSGARGFVVSDPDIVDEANLGPQGYLPCQIGMPKTAALAQSIGSINPDCWAASLPENPRARAEARFSRLRQTDVLVLCVDSFEARRTIYEACTRALPTHRRLVVLDARMAALNGAVFSWDSANPIYDYVSTLDPDQPTRTETCSTRSTNFCASLCADLLMVQLVRYLRNEALAPYVNFDLETFNMFSLMLPPGARPVSTPLPTTPRPGSLVPTNTREAITSFIGVSEPLSPMEPATVDVFSEEPATVDVFSDEPGTITDEGEDDDGDRGYANSELQPPVASDANSERHPF